jgi:hypothetical protein
LSVQAGRAKLTLSLSRGEPIFDRVLCPASAVARLLLEGLTPELFIAAVQENFENNLIRFGMTARSRNRKCRDFFPRIYAVLALSAHATVDDCMTAGTHDV